MSAWGGGVCVQEVAMVCVSRGVSVSSGCVGPGVSAWGCVSRVCTPPSVDRILDTRL